MIPFVIPPGTVIEQRARAGQRRLDGASSGRKPQVFSVKRIKGIKLVLLGSLSAGILAGCGQRPAPITTTSVYTNNFFVAGVGYYHAPYHAWFSLPYNYFDPRSGRYFCGGKWAEMAVSNPTNTSSPTAEAAQWAEAHRTDVDRGGFGSTGHVFSHHA